MLRTSAALQEAGYGWEAETLQKIGADKTQWEDYARKTFCALREVIPAAKLRFLQYVTPKTLSWWQAQASNGAVLLGKAARDLD